MSDFYIKKGDLEPSITQKLVGHDGNPVSLTGATVAFRWKGPGGITGSGSATVVDEPTAQVAYGWAAGDTDIPGEYEGEWVVTTSGKDQTIPSNGYLTFTIGETLA